MISSGRYGSQPVTVYKVGGSLFDWPDLPGRLGAFLDQESTQPLLVSGGGTAADVVRDWDRIYGLGDVAAHALAIHSMHLGERLITSLLPRAVLIDDRQQAARVWQDGGIPVLHMAAFVDSASAAGMAPLPPTWIVTSDSLAAWVARYWPANLVLLKSTSPESADKPFTDAAFGDVAAAVARVGWVNLRSGRRGWWPSPSENAR